jgi:hypothetical protein
MTHRRPLIRAFRHHGLLVAAWLLWLILPGPDATNLGGDL